MSNGDNKNSVAPAALLTAASILDIDDTRIEELYIPEWNGTVFLKSWSGNKRAQFENAVLQYRGNDVRVNTKQARQWAAVLSLCDKEGSLLFKTTQVKELDKKSSAALERIFKRVQAINGLDVEVQEELQGNLSVTQG
jgi:hypothetical protein